MKCKPKGSIYSLNEGYASAWSRGIAEYIHSRKVPGPGGKVRAHSILTSQHNGHNVTHSGRNRFYHVRNIFSFLYFTFLIFVLLYCLPALSSHSLVLLVSWLFLIWPLYTMQGFDGRTCARPPGCTLHFHGIRNVFYRKRFLNSLEVLLSWRQQASISR